VILYVKDILKNPPILCRAKSSSICHHQPSSNFTKVAESSGATSSLILSTIAETMDDFSILGLGCGIWINADLYEHFEIVVFGQIRTDFPIAA
jgi:hypothetical protein